MRDEIRSETGKEMRPEEIAEGFIEIAVANMAKAIRRISLERGHDVTQHVLVAFGGAAGQHACLVADRLGIRQIMIHPLAGVLSAYGIGVADVRRLREQSMQQLLDSAGLTQIAETLRQQVRAEIDAQNVPVAAVEFVVSAELSYAGVDTALPVQLDEPEAMRTAFEMRHRERFGFAVQDRPVIVQTLSVEGIGKVAVGIDPVAPAIEAVEPPASVTAHIQNRDCEVPVRDRDALGDREIISGPAIIRERNATTVVEPGWRASVDRCRNLILQRVEAAQARTTTTTAVDPVQLEIFNNAFMAIAEEMGVALQNTAISVNIKERLDFSCALFDPEGALIANAPHIPVHLGSMGDSVRTIIAARADARDGRGIQPGDVYVLNAPYHGGSHLPDVTVIMPAFTSGGEIARLCRGAWASCGYRRIDAWIHAAGQPPRGRRGRAAGQCPAGGSGAFPRTGNAANCLPQPPTPRAIPISNISDLKAQVAACFKGVCRAAQPDRALRGRCGARLYASRAGSMPPNRCAA